MLELKHIDKYYNQGTINEMCLFEDFNLTVNENEFVSVVGSNGSGKTTLLNIICGSIPIDSGRIIINGKISAGCLNLNASAPLAASIRILLWEPAPI